MGLFGWLKPRSNKGAVRAWRDRWTRAVETLDADALASLDAALRQQPPLADDVEMEEEMLDGLRHLLELERELAAARLPAVDTTHRVVGADRCHFSAPVSLPDDPAQPTGRLLLTGTRAVFAGGARPTVLAWHATADVVQTDRDVLLVRGDGTALHRFRCNSYGDALTAAAIARHLAARARGPAESRTL